jgi:hypothetical protein
MMIILVALVVMTGCASRRPLKGGKAAIQASTGTNGMHQFVSEMKQPENPAQSAAQNYERTTETELPIPAQSKVQEVVTSPPAKAGEAPVKQEKTIVLSEPTVQKTRVVEKAGTVIGAAQKDTAREVGAKLASLKGVVWVGLGLFLFGLASLVYPPLRAIIGSVTTSVGMAAGGVALMVLPTMIVGNELLILGGVAVAVGAWFLAHRHGQLKGMVDANQNGIDDRIEAALAKLDKSNQGKVSES